MPCLCTGGAQASCQAEALPGEVAVQNVWQRPRTVRGLLCWLLLLLYMLSSMLPMHCLDVNLWTVRPKPVLTVSNV